MTHPSTLTRAVRGTTPRSSTGLRTSDTVAIEAPQPLDLGLRMLSEFSTAPPEPLLVDRLDPEGITILFGDGGIGKGTLTSHWIIQLAKTGKKVLILDYENHPEEWSRRIFGFDGPSVLEQTAHVAPHTARWHGSDGAIWNQKEEVRDLIERDGYDFVVIDSIVPACGGTDASKTEAASQYQGAMAYFGVPSLSLAHVNRAKDHTKPFGSAFWHNLARITWSMEREGKLILLKSRKSNNYKRPQAQSLEFHWNDRGLPVALTERPYQQSVIEQVHDVLTKPMTVYEIAEVLNDGLDATDTRTNERAISKALQRAASERFISRPDGRKVVWQRADQSPELVVMPEADPEAL